MAKGIVWTAQAQADIRGIERLIALQILKTLARYAQTGEGNTKQLQGIEPPLIRLRAQDHRVFFRDKDGSWRSPACFIVRRLTADGL
jgi:hypothetical protein